MGKKNKIRTDNVDIANDNMKLNKKRKALIIQTANVDTISPERVKRNRKNKTNTVTNSAMQDSDVVRKQANKVDKHTAAMDNADVNIINGPIKANKRKKDMTPKNDTIPKNKKIVFDDDGQVEDDPQKIENGNGGKKQKQFLSGEEAAVTEEEIDRFCDELDEEDNVQFDNWVKLIEEKLNPKRNKNK